MTQRRSQTRRDRSIAVTGAVVLGLVLFGIVVTAARSETASTLQPVVFPLDITGTYHAAGPRGTTGPGGVCLPEAPGAMCTPATLTLDLRIDGLPGLRGGAHYVVSLTGSQGDRLVLGPLVAESGAQTMAQSMERDARAFDRLVVTLEDRPRPAEAGGLVLYERQVSGDAPVGLDEEVRMTATAATGTTEMKEIGAVTVSTTITLRIDDVEAREGWVHRVWLHAEDRSATFVGELRYDASPGRATLEERIERVRIAEQTLLAVTLEPVGGATSDGPQGLSLLAAEL